MAELKMIRWFLRVEIEDGYDRLDATPRDVEKILMEFWKRWCYACWWCEFFDRAMERVRREGEVSRLGGGRKGV